MNMWNEIIISHNTMIFCSMMSQNNSQLHQQPHMNATRLNTTADTTVSMQDDSDEMQEVIEVQILPQVGSHLFLKRYIQRKCFSSFNSKYLPNYIQFTKNHSNFHYKY